MNRASILAVTLLLFSLYCPLSGQVQIHPVKQVALEPLGIKYCFNNTKLMVGKSADSRHLVYFSDDTIYVVSYTNGSWQRNIARTGKSILSATITRYADSIWLCWKEGPLIMASYSTSGGEVWSTPIPVSDAGRVSSPSVWASQNGRICFVWSNESDAGSVICYRSYDNGSLTDSTITISNPEDMASFPSVIAVGDTVLCTWKVGKLPSKVWFSSSFNGGVHWNEAVLTAPSLSASKDPNLAHAFDSVSGTHYVYLAYDGRNKIYFQRSTDWGVTWSDPEVISNQSKSSQFAHVDCNHRGFVGVSYEQFPSGTSLFNDKLKDVGFTYSTNWGAPGSFGADTLAYTGNPLGSIYAALCKVSETAFYLTWLSVDSTGGNTHVFERNISLDYASSVNEGIYREREITIIPNPVVDVCTVGVERGLHNATVFVYNEIGTEVIRLHDVSGLEIRLDCSDVHPGPYFIKISQAAENALFGKFTVWR